jgi:cytoskeletal protein RodZ
MDDFGGRLRQARERRGISLRQIAASTKISVAALEALERNDISKLPGGIFSRAFVKSYATEVGLDPDQTVRDFLERFHQAPPPSDAHVSHHVPEQESQFESQQRMASVMLKLVAISVPLIVAILYFTLRSRPAATPAAEAPAPEPAPASVADSAFPTAPVAQASLPAPSTPRAATTAPAATPASMRLELHPAGLCWVSLTVDGKKVFGRLMQPGERAAYTVQKDAVLEIGDAGAFGFSVDGREGRSLGTSGQVRTLKITRDSVATQVK